MGNRAIGAVYNPEELNWVDQDSSEPWVDFRNQGPDITCKGKLQRRGFYKSTCELIDLDDLHFTVRPHVREAITLPFWLHHMNAKVQSSTLATLQVHTGREEQPAKHVRARGCTRPFSRRASLLLTRGGGLPCVCICRT